MRAVLRGNLGTDPRAKQSLAVLAVLVWRHYFSAPPVGGGAGDNGPHERPAQACGVGQEALRMSKATILTVDDGAIVPLAINRDRPSERAAMSVCFVHRPTAMM
jgi:hypothetical protein